MKRPISQCIAEYEMAWTRHPSPIEWSTVFGREAPLVVEIGFGNGEFLADQARAHPERDYVGIEVSWGSLTRLFRRLDKTATHNVRVIQEDAAVVLGLCFETGSVSQAIINHPCPWPKDRHAARRLIQPNFIALLCDRLRSGGRLSIRTDHDAYATEIGAVLDAEEALREAPEPPEEEHLRRVVTKYQRQAMASGIGIHYFEHEKAGTPGRQVALPEPLPPDSMPSVLLSGSFDAETLLHGLSREPLREERDGVEIVVRLLSAFHHVERETWLVEALVKEGPLCQEFGILVVAQQAGGLLIKLGLGNPKPTYGVKRAVWLVGRWLTETHATLSVAEDTLGALSEP